MLNPRLLNRCSTVACVSRRAWRALYTSDKTNIEHEQHLVCETKRFGSSHHQNIQNQNTSSEGSAESRRNVFGIGLVSTALIGYGLYWKIQRDTVSAAVIEAGLPRKDLPTYTAEDVRKHKTKETKVWVTYKCAVYDITDYLTNHPGGSKIMWSVGGALEPFWDMYPVHRQENVSETLEEFRIGNISPSEQEQLVAARTRPPKPRVDLNTYRLDVLIGDKNKLILNMEDLKKIPKKSAKTPMNCKGKQSSDEDIWTGAILSEVMRKAGVDLEKSSFKYVVFEGLDKKPDGSHYGTRIPMEQVRQHRNDILLVYERNGNDLFKEQGYPVRGIIPGGEKGFIHVKFLKNIRLSNE